MLANEQEYVRVHGRAARAIANQGTPLSFCSILRDENMFNSIDPEAEEKEKNSRTRYNGRQFISWLQEVDDKFEKIKVGKRKTWAPIQYKDAVLPVLEIPMWR